MLLSMSFEREKKSTGQGKKEKIRRKSINEIIVDVRRKNVIKCCSFVRIYGLIIRSENFED
jgi:hypothetical protein